MSEQGRIMPIKNRVNSNGKGNAPKPVEGEPFKFVNPYNFVPLGENEPTRKEPKDVYQDSRELQSGWLDVKLTTETEIIVPDGSHPKIHRVSVPDPIIRGTTKIVEHKEFAFFTLPGSNDPVIPGSELRGMLRSVYEAATNSCMPFLPNDDKPISQRTPTFASFKNRGLLEYDTTAKQWRLYSGKTVQTVDTTISESKRTENIKDPSTGKACHMGDKATINGESAWIQLNAAIGYRDNPYHVHWIAKDALLKEWEPGDADALDQMKSVLKQDSVKGNQADGNSAHRKELVNALNQIKQTGGCIPVWYLEVNEEENSVFYLSNSAIGRVAQHARWSKIIGEHSPCGSKHVKDGLCPACLLFGTVAQNGLKGRVRFTDALPQKVTGKTVHTLQILGEPRPSAFEFYSIRPAADAGMWNFDYYSVKTWNSMGEPCSESKALTARGIRGRKMYWHSNVAKDGTPGGQNATMEAVNAGSEFAFRVYFDGITPQQLQDLIWTITLGDNTAASPLRHKLGHAKPLGYGSVKLVVEKCVLRTVKQAAGGIQLTIEDKPVDSAPQYASSLEKNVVDSLLAMVDVRKTKGLEVCYPLHVNRGNETIFDWFSNNRKNAASLKTLPYPTDSVITLKGRRLPKGDGQSKATPITAPAAPVATPKPATPSMAAPKATQPPKKRNNNFKGEPGLLVGQVCKATVTNVYELGRLVFLKLENGEQACFAFKDKWTGGKERTIKLLSYSNKHQNYRAELV